MHHKNTSEQKTDPTKTTKYQIKENHNNIIKQRTVHMSAGTRMIIETEQNQV